MSNHHILILGVVMAVAISGMIITFNPELLGQVVGANMYGETYSNYGVQVNDVQAGAVNPGPSAYVCCSTASLLGAGLNDCPSNNDGVVELCSLGQGVNGPEFKYSSCYAGEIRCPLK